MGWYGLQVARLFGRKLPVFGSQADAESRLFAERDERLRRICELKIPAAAFDADFTPESLKDLEHAYFALWESEGFNALGVSREEFERCMAMYFLEVVVRNCREAKWIVQEYAFERGKYEMGVQRGHLTIVRARFEDHFKQRNNKKRQWIYREYQRHFDRPGR